MNWILIEGDNGTGKDTLREFFEADGWFHVNADSQVVDLLKVARSCTGRDRVPAYLEYARFCMKIASLHGATVVCVRYWPSTLSAAFADLLISEEEFLSAVDRCLVEFDVPKYVIQLTCDFATRVSRIKKRGFEPNGHVDNIDAGRAKRVEIAFAIIASKFPTPWLVQETSNLQPSEVFHSVFSWVQKQKGDLDVDCSR